MNTLLLALLVGLSLAAVIAFFLRLGARWAKSPRRSFLHAYAFTIALALYVFGILCGAETTLGLDPPTFRAWVPTSVVLVGGIVLLLAWRYRTSVLGTVRVVLGLGAGVGAAVGLAFLLVGPFLLEGSIGTRSGSMAPSSRGLYAVQTCRHCGGELVIPLDLSDEELAAGRARGMRFDAICADCLKPDRVEELFEHIHAREIYFTNKTARNPRRWDRIAFGETIRPDQHDVIAIFDYPDPSRVWNKRLVGLPGEEVVIRDGGIWIDGVRQEPPGGVPRVSYTSGPIVNRKMVFWGTPENPARLGADEFFVLGDNTTVSIDSRLFGPIPRDKIVGATDVIFWPPKRWRYGP